MDKIDNKAIIHKTAKIGNNVKIGYYSVIGENVVIKDNVAIGSHVVIEKDTIVGEGCKLFNFASLGTDPQDLKYKGEQTTLALGKNNVVREFATLNRGSGNGGGVTSIGDNNLFMAYSHIAHDCHIGNNIVIANAVQLAGHVTIEDFAILGGSSVVHQFSRIGKNAIVGGASAVPQDVPPFMNAVGNRAELHGLNLVGLKRHNYSPSALNNLKKAYMIIFRSKQALADALKEVEDTMSECAEVMYLLNFLKESQQDSKRGFIRACKRKSSMSE